MSHCVAQCTSYGVLSLQWQNYLEDLIRSSYLLQYAEWPTVDVI